MPSDKVQRQLERLKLLRTQGVSESGLKELRKCLQDRVNVVVAKAADIVLEWHSKDLLPDLLNAFTRLLDVPEADPQCWGKNAISRSLKDLGFAESAVFIRGLQHRQFESTWGGKIDTALDLRATCALALVQCTDLPRHETLRYLVDAVTEAEARVRTDAARALEQMGGREVELLLRLKARAGDREVRVTGQVLESILHLEGAQGVPFVAAFLQSINEEMREEAALALGASRLPQAVEALKQEWTRSARKSNATILLRAISASREDSALEFLLNIIRTDRLDVAEEALFALDLHRDSEEIVKRIAAVVGDRQELADLFSEKFGGRWFSGVP